MTHKQPVSKNCFICGRENPMALGLNFYDNEPGTVEAIWVPSPTYQGFPGLAHGGVTAAVLDETAGRTITGSKDFPNRMLVTVKLELRYRKPVFIGKTYKAVGKLIKDQNRVVTSESYLIDENGEVAVSAYAVMAEPPKDVLDQLDWDPNEWDVESTEG